MDKTCLSYWFPKLQATGVPIPQTHIITLQKSLWFACGEDYSDSPECLARIAQTPQLCKDIAACAESLGGYPVFLRTGQTSGKHSWKDTCYLTEKGAIEDHVFNLWEYGELADICGLDSSVWVVREILKTTAPFTAFGGFPVTKERRYFIKDGEIVGKHPYWPPFAVEEHVDSESDWRKKLDQLNFQDPRELKELRELNSQVAKAFDGAWSIDWLWTDDRGWVCIDMAEACKSFIWHDHPDAPKCEFKGDRL